MIGHSPVLEVYLQTVLDSAAETDRSHIPSAQLQTNVYQAQLKAKLPALPGDFSRTMERAVRGWRFPEGVSLGPMLILEPEAQSDRSPPFSGSQGHDNNAFVSDQLRCTHCRSQPGGSPGTHAAQRHWNISFHSSYGSILSPAMKPFHLNSLPPQILGMETELLLFPTLQSNSHLYGQSKLQALYLK